ncbi:hypothetical protein [Algisphaera agarilytica]|uniref:Uncharacterized protein n=1 Tax=Algisphaera agarilytica TaxID=1385975 RepID=A0A7X0LK16_9BACT|nr:hypothetical protein [Algisphaera agarilytica]MBB6429437.1 hypothetical protein [Algisphaera agarilytica]
MNTTELPKQTTPQRLRALIGRLRAKQLDLAQRGKTRTSALYAQRAQRARQALALAA